MPRITSVVITDKTVHLSFCCEGQSLCERDGEVVEVCNALEEGGDYCFDCVEIIRKAIQAPRRAPVVKRYD